ncbi:MAG TPA: disulfide oxidoreductase [Roseiflexaceae bacterium]|nr:disulfide oxidoreductase [Roseiflexaceae bacterium]
MAQERSQLLYPHDRTLAESETPAEWLLGVVSLSSPYVALLAAWVAMCGSLFFSEVLGWVPCVLCWYQRILMYPLAVIIAVGLLRRDDRLHLYVLPLSLFGACISLYHYLLIKTDWLSPPACVSGIPCTVEYLDWFGFINIPFLALTAFLIISFMVVAATFAPDRELEAAALPGEQEEPEHQRRPLVSAEQLAVPGIIALVLACFIIGARFL